VEITEATEVPEIKPRNQRLKEPSKEDLYEQQRKKDEHIEKERKKLQALIQKSRLVKEGGKIQGEDISIKQFMQQKKALVDQIDKLIAVEDKAIKKIEEGLEGHTSQREELQAKLVKGFKHEDQIQSEIQALQSRYQSSSITSGQEKTIVNDIKKLEASLPAATKLKEMQPYFDNQKDKKKVHLKALHKLRDERKGHQAEKKEKYEVHQENFEKNQEKKGEIEEIEGDIQDQKAKIDQVFE